MKNLVERVLSVLAPPPKQTVSEWADAERVLSRESSAEYGKWRTNRAPYQQEILDAFSDKNVERVVAMTSAQVGKSEILLNVMGYHIDKDPCPMLIVQPSLILAEDFSKDRVAPMIRDTPTLGEKVGEAASRDSGNTVLNKKFLGGQAIFAGANSPGSLAGRPTRVVLLDEVDRFPASAGTEGDPVNLAIKRTTAFYNKKIGMFSTPTIKGASRIEEAYEESDKRRRFVPCPHCGHEQTLEWEQLKFKGRERGKIKNIRYECIECRKGIDESEKYLMDKKGKWIAEKPFAGIAGFHINALYSPWVRWEALIVDFLESRKNPEKLKVFWNTMLARSFEVRGEAPEWRRLYDGREKFPLRIVPAPACFVTGSADVQLNRIEVMAVAWARDKQNWTIDHRILEGDTAKPEVWKELDKYIHEEFAHETSGVLLPIKMFAIDSSYATSTVYSWARKQMASKVMAIKGSASISMTVGKPTFVDVTTQGKRTARGLMLWPIGVSKIKEDLYSWLRLEKPLDGAEYPPCFCHFPEFDDEFFKQLTAEDLVKKVGKNKFAKYEWVKNRDRNEVLDLWVMARAAASRVGLDRMTDVHWAELERHAGFNLKKQNYVENIENPAPTIEEAEVIPSPPPQESYVLPRRKSEYW